jgi:hypothetical protein
VTAITIGAATPTAASATSATSTALSVPIDATTFLASSQPSSDPPDSMGGNETPPCDRCAAAETQLQQLAQAQTDAVARHTELRHQHQHALHQLQLQCQHQVYQAQQQLHEQRQQHHELYVCVFDRRDVCFIVVYLSLDGKAYFWSALDVLKSLFFL